MENNLQIIQYDGKIAIVDEKIEVKEGDIGFNIRLSKVLKTEKLERLIGIPFIPKLLAHSPHIDGVADIVIESKENIKEVSQLVHDYYGEPAIEVDKPSYDNIIDFAKFIYTQAKQNTYTEEQMFPINKELMLLDKRIEGLIYDLKNDFDRETVIGRLKAMKVQSGRMLDGFQQLNQKQYELIRIDENGNYVIKEK